MFYILIKTMTLKKLLNINKLLHFSDRFLGVQHQKNTMKVFIFYLFQKMFLVE